jgi:hypothetical protein
MAINFPNPSRSYEEKKHGVSFWGYDQTIEISFFVEDSALSKIDSKASADELGFLNTFDLNCERIREVADSTYSRSRKASHIFSFTLTTSDF